MTMKKSIEITIPEPCHEDWAKMTPTQKGKHCAVCQKEVIDFTQMTDEQIFKATKKENNLCGRLTKRQLERPIQLQRKEGTSWAGYAATILVPATMLMTQSINAQHNTKPTEQTEKNYKSIGISSLTRSAQHDISRKQNEEDTLQKQHTHIIKGVVSEENGPLPGASIYIKGTDKGTQSNFDGEYELEVTIGDTIVITYIGYKTLEVSIQKEMSALHLSNMNFILESESLLNEIIIVGKLRIKESDTTSEKGSK